MPCVLVDSTQQHGVTSILSLQLGINDAGSLCVDSHLPIEYPPPPRILFKLHFNKVLTCVFVPKRYHSVDWMWLRGSNINQINQTVTLNMEATFQSYSWEHSHYIVAIITHHVTKHNTPIHNILSTAPQLSISQKALRTLSEDGNVMPKHVGATIHKHNKLN
jgi:hypothetical protein